MAGERIRTAWLAVPERQAQLGSPGGADGLAVSSIEAPAHRASVSTSRRWTPRALAARGAYSSEALSGRAWSNLPGQQRDSGRAVR